MWTLNWRTGHSPTHTLWHRAAPPCGQQKIGAGIPRTGRQLRSRVRAQHVTRLSLAADLHDTRPPPTKAGLDRFKGRRNNGPQRALATREHRPVVCRFCSPVRADEGLYSESECRDILTFAVRGDTALGWAGAS